MGQKKQNNSKLLASTITECISISAFATLVGIPIGITGSAIGLEICNNFRN